jgi:transcriptional regulator with XRE-family HTH domain
MSNSKQEEQFLDRLASKISTLRKSKGLSQERLAELADVDRVALANIETGRRRPTVTTLYRLARGMKVHVRDLFN